MAVISYMPYAPTVPTTGVNWTWGTATNASTTSKFNGTATNYVLVESAPSNGIPAKIPAGKREIELPDGAKLVIDDLGNYQIEDKSAKVTYRANRVREFSPHMNASDMLAEFIRYVGTLGVKQSEVLGLPIELFINWLIIEAADRDHDPIPDGVTPVQRHPALQLVKNPKCRSCGKFIRHEHLKQGFPFCSFDHGAVFARKRLAIAA